MAGDGGLTLAGHPARGIIEIGPLRFQFGAGADELVIDPVNVIDLSTAELNAQNAQLTSFMEQAKHQQTEIEDELTRRRSAGS